MYKNKKNNPYKLLNYLIMTLVVSSCGYNGFQSTTSKDPNFQNSIHLSEEEIEDYNSARSKDIQEGFVPIGDMNVHHDLIDNKDLETFFPQEHQKKKDSFQASGAYHPGIKTWKNGVLPISFSSSFSSSQKSLFFKYCQDMSETAKIKCITRSNQTDYIKVETTSENSICGWSYLGRIGGRQTLKINKGAGCLNERVVSHELMHALGGEISESCGFENRSIAA